jgi:hypothetical protein
MYIKVVCTYLVFQTVSVNNIQNVKINPSWAKYQNFVNPPEKNVCIML